MAFTFITEANVTAYTTGTITTAAFNVSAGDLIVVAIGVINAGVWAASLADTAGNSYTLLTPIVNVVGSCTQTFAYCLSSSAQAGNQVTVTFNEAVSNCRKNALASVYTPDGGETVTYDVEANAISGWEASPWETGTCNTTGDDEVCVASVQTTAAVTFSNQEIPGGTAATLLTSPSTTMAGWYRILAATAAGLYAEIDVDASRRYVMQLVTFKSVVAGGLSIPRPLSRPLSGPFGGI